jgi:3-oxoacyl-[acyl-carrier protein] reductase
LRSGLEGKTVLVTEVARNLGKPTALAFAAEGANLVLASLDGGEALEQAAHEAEASGVKVVTATCDTSDGGQVRELARKALAEFGCVDVLVNNALLPAESLPLEQLSFQAWKRKLDVELRGAMLVCQAVIPAMVERQWGRVINFAGLSAFNGDDPISSTAELGMVGLTRGIAREYGKFNITANCICPAGVEASEAGVPAAYPPSDGDPIPRWGKGEEVGFLAVSLASEDAGYLTGQCLLPNGGKYFL